MRTEVSSLKLICKFNKHFMGIYYGPDVVARLGSLEVLRLGVGGGWGRCGNKQLWHNTMTLIEAWIKCPKIWGWIWSFCLGKLEKPSMGEWDICVRPGRMRQDFPARERQEGTPQGEREHKRSLSGRIREFGLILQKHRGDGMKRGAEPMLWRLHVIMLRSWHLILQQRGFWWRFKVWERHGHFTKAATEAERLSDHSWSPGPQCRERPEGTVTSLLAQSPSFFTFSSLKISLHFYSKGPFLLQVNSYE